MNLQDFATEKLTIELIRKLETNGYVFYPTRSGCVPYVKPIFNEKYNMEVITIRVSTWMNILMSQNNVLEHVSISEEQGKPVITERYSGAFTKMFDENGYILLLDGTDFLEKNNTIEPLMLFTTEIQMVGSCYCIKNAQELLSGLGVKFITSK